MANLGNKLTVDDLIVEYMMYKVQHGYDPQFSLFEIMNFLHFFQSKMSVQDFIDEGRTLFQEFFKNKAKGDWREKPHMDIEYDTRIDDYIIRANYRLSDYDKSMINTYFMDNGMGKFDNFKGTTFKIRTIIGEYLSNQTKRTIDESIEVDEKELMIGKYLSAEIIAQIWHSYICKQVDNQSWPRQCNDINKFLFELDLADIIGVPSIKNDLIEVYKVLSKRIAILYHEDPNLNVSSNYYSYLAGANYELLIQGYEKIIGIAFGCNQKSLEFDLSSLTFRESHEIDGIYDWDEEPDIKTTMTMIENDKVKKIVRNIEKLRQ